jgi:anti-sigma regulatory factor (Ser/Thr protein kinase)
MTASPGGALGVADRPGALTRPPLVGSERPAGFRHEAFFYAGEEEFLAGTLPLIERALEQGQPVLVAVPPAKVRLLREGLDARAGCVAFLDMHELGRNPARIIPAWQQFLEEHAPSSESPLGIGEPVWPGRSAAELTECERHERLLNLAFAGSRSWRLLCPYDLDRLAANVIEAARDSHPYLGDADGSERNVRYRESDWPQRAFVGQVPEPGGPVQEIEFDRSLLAQARSMVAARAARAGLASGRTQQLVLAVSELTGNSVRHGGGGGRLRIWQEGHTLLCEVRDDGHIDVPLAGRLRPRPEQLTGRGLWLVNQLCDLVQIRAEGTGTLARVQMDLSRSD